MNGTVGIVTVTALLLICGGLIASPAVAQNETDIGDDWGWEWWSFAGLDVFICFIPVIAVIIAIAIGVWMYRDAEKRGESGALWLIIGIIGGIIGLIIWLIVRPDVETEQEQRGERYCPDCGRSIPIDASVCPYCGHSFR